MIRSSPSGTHRGRMPQFGGRGAQSGLLSLVGIVVLGIHVIIVSQGSLRSLFSIVGLCVLVLLVSLVSVDFQGSLVSLLSLVSIVILPSLAIRVSEICPWLGIGSGLGVARPHK